jgi:serine/threonine protein kinase
MLNLEQHSNVLGLQDVFEDDSSYYIVMKRCSGGELFDFLNSETDVPERECKRIMREILAAVDHIHSQGLIHRDIKPENIMFHTERDGGSATPSPKENGTCRSIRLIDFDSALEMQGSASPRQKHIVGTMGYIAPEALKGDCSPASDLWSVGIIMYMLMTGDTPYDEELLDEAPKDTRCDSEAMDRLYTKLQRAKIDFECEPWPSFPEARDLCQELLAFEPSDRSPSAMHALSHPWLN